nr:C-type lectin domain family 2 member B-like [Chrysemys picta bellii]
MDPTGKKLRSEVYSDIPGNPESGAEPGNGRSCRLRKRTACTVAVSVVLVILIVAVVVLAVLVLKAQPQFMVWCPDSWIGYRGKCYYFSEAEENWNNSRSNCSVLGASLAVIDSEQDLVRRKTDPFWGFPIRGGGNCAYLNDNGVSASRCITERHWVCNKPDAYTSQKNTTQRIRNY